MSTWLPAAMLALFSFGLWGFFTKLSVVYVDYKSAMVFQSLGVALVGLIGFGMINFKPEFNLKGLGYSTLTGVSYGLGCLFYFLAVTRGKAITVVTLTALYPLITIFLAFFLLNETITLRQSCGVALALIAIILMAI